MGDATTVIESPARTGTTASVAEMAALLQEVLTRELAAFATGVGDPADIARMATGVGTEQIDARIERRLRAAYDIVVLLLAHDAPRTVRSWFFGRKLDLGDASPAEALRSDRFAEASLAAHAFLAHG